MTTNCSTFCDASIAATAASRTLTHRALEEARSRRVTSCRWPTTTTTGPRHAKSNLYPSTAQRAHGRGCRGSRPSTRRCGRPLVSRASSAPRNRAPGRPSRAATARNERPCPTGFRAGRPPRNADYWTPRMRKASPRRLADRLGGLERT
ncbi:hypothetical protein M885DRAFT_525344 [Pelagophyceae sp. CCMP2097]|nr:hypothetical protein M885DRAFT_525344 [Pelagophyceae sp. CCMP2097]